MKTSVWNIKEAVDNHSLLKEAATLLQKNEVVAFPTETVYGLGANAKSDEALKKIFTAKGRPSDNPLIIHIASIQQANEIVEEIPEMAQVLMDAFWPGPLTLVLRKKAGLSDVATAGLDTVAIRMPDHPIALSLIREANLPIAAPSANLSGKPSPTTAQHVEKDLAGRISGIVDGGETGVGVESTVVDCTEAVPVILRPGGVTKEELQRIIGEVKEDTALHNKEAAPKSPGMKYTHYAPEAPFVLVEGSPMFIQSLMDEKKAAGKKVGVLTTEENKEFYQADCIIPCGQRSKLSTVASGLYDALRAFDECNVDVIFGEVFPREGIGEAIMNRMMKAAGHTVVKEK
ncbi:L-threonylcarbamoyladenylate synthase [Bacillus massiliigorillae]|uniref:L-threonylcarbamoyladenylate synthase n=1 Tax=Bacillus massiliigorillae TaxID=1243664 RepID=UPI0003A00AD9|nr:L-threonylcarbamoyladenylate synthase [Bacillus massiliigorillae]